MGEAVKAVKVLKKVKSNMERGSC